MRTITPRSNQSGSVLSTVFTVISGSPVSAAYVRGVPLVVTEKPRSSSVGTRWDTNSAASASRNEPESRKGRPVVSVQAAISTGRCSASRAASLMPDSAPRSSRGNLA